MLPSADLVIGAVLIHGARAPHVITREQLGLMKSRAVLVDVSIDQGGCFAPSRPTTHSDPTFQVDDVTHYCVTNMPGAVPVTATYALTNATLPYVLHVAGLESDDEHTVLVVAVLGLASTVSIGSAKSRIAVWALAALGALLLIPAQTSGPLDLARLDLPLLMLGLAGAGFAMLAVMDGRRRALEPSLAAEQGET